VMIFSKVVARESGKVSEFVNAANDPK
jgi:hypothetical protein